MQGVYIGKSMGRAKERPPAIPVSIMDRLWTLRPSQTSIWSPRTAGSRGRLRISVALLFGHVAMGRIAARFTEASPEVRLEIIAEDRYVDLVEEGYDIAIRVNPDPDDQLVGRRFLHDQLLLVAPASLPRPLDRDLFRIGPYDIRVPLELLGRDRAGGPSMRQ